MVEIFVGIGSLTNPRGPWICINVNTGAWVEEIYSGSSGTQSGHPSEVRQVEEGAKGWRGVRLFCGFL